MALAVIFVMVMTSAVTWIVYAYVLIPLHIEYLYIIAFILLIAALVQLVEMMLEKTSPALYHALGIYLPLITTNCAVLGIAVLNKDMFFSGGAPSPGSFIKSIVNGLGGGVGFAMALFLMSAIRERLEVSDIPEAMKEIPIAFITAALISIAFMGFL
jgi:electron transport complex protein RnfA